MKYKCIRYKTDERYFTIGKVYTYDGGIVNDNGYKYEWESEPALMNYLSCWYEFEIVDDEDDSPPDVVKVIFNYPATIVFFSDGTKEVVQCRDGDWFDEEKGIAMALLKKAYGKAYYSKCIRPFLPNTFLRDYL